jgi:hypothetical protein
MASEWISSALTPLGPQSGDLIWPSATHLALTALLYAWLTAERAMAVLQADRRYADFVAPGGDQGRGARVAANLRNQFEAPLLFHMLVLALAFSDGAVQAQLWLAWVFVAGRVLHTGVQTLSTNVPLRGGVFSINFLALAGMWIVFFTQTVSTG